MEKRYSNLAYLTTLFDAVGNLFLWVCDNEFHVIQSSCPWETELANLFYLNGNAKRAQAFIRDRKDFLILSDNLGLNWIILADRSTGGDEISLIYVLGPTFPVSISSNNLKEYLDANHMSISSQIKLLHLIGDIPIMAVSHFTDFGSMLYAAVLEKKPDKNSLYYFYQTGEPPQNAAGHKVETVAHHGALEYEKDIMRIVENGDIQYRMRLRGSLSVKAPDPGIMSPGDPVRQMKDQLIVLTTLCTRAAVKGGLPEETAYTLSDYYIQNIEKNTSMSDLTELAGILFDDFVQKVHDVKESPAKTPLIRCFLAAIQGSIPGKTDLATIAGSLGYAPYYLTHRLKEETGMTFKEAVKKEQISYAKMRLEDHHCSIQELGKSLGYSTPSYFAAVFKEETGMTPKEYQKKSAIGDGRF